MSRRFYLVVCGLLLALISFQLFVLFGQRRDPSLASIRCSARNAGIPIAASNASVEIFAAGRRGEPVVRGRLGQALDVSPGVYDVKLEYTASDDRQEAWIERLEVKRGEIREGEAEFAAGTLRVRVRNGRREPRPGEARCDIFRPGNFTVPVTTKAPGEPALLATGKYDVRVVLLEGAKEAGVTWIRGVEVQRGLLAEREASFRRGTLLVTGKNAGQELPPGSVSFTLYKAGDVQLEVVDQGEAGVPLTLETGRYDIRATLTTAGDRPEAWLRDVAVEEGRVTERTAAFAAGFLQVGAKLSGGDVLDGFRAYVYVYPTSDHQRAVTYYPAGETLLLSEGKYDLRVQFFRSHDQPEIWKYGVAVRSGSIARHEVPFDSGRLIVRCMRRGQEQTGDNAFISVYEAGDRRTPVARARTGEELVLQSGEYDIRVRHTVAQRELWATGIKVRAGGLTDHAVRMD